MPAKRPADSAFDENDDDHRSAKECRIDDDSCTLNNALMNCRHFLAFRTPQRVGREFFDVDAEQLAKSLLGQHLVRRLKDGTLLKAKILETESYPGGEDRASHSFNGKRTERNEPMYMEPGTAYVYLSYGMYYCFNISSRGDGAAVLLRAARPLCGLDRVRSLRGRKRKDGGKKLRPNQLLNGPSKLCMGLEIEKDAMNKEFLPSSELLWIEHDPEAVVHSTIVTSKRIGIDSVAKESSEQPLRFYLLEEASFVSVRDQVAEKLL